MEKLLKYHERQLFYLENIEYCQKQIQGAHDFEQRIKRNYNYAIDPQNTEKIVNRYKRLIEHLKERYNRNVKLTTKI